MIYLIRKLLLKVYTYKLRACNLRGLGKCYYYYYYVSCIFYLNMFYFSPFFYRYYAKMLTERIYGL